MVVRPGASILVFPSLSFPYRLPEGLSYVHLADVTPDMAADALVVDPADARSEDDVRENEARGYIQWTHSFVTPAILSTPQRLVACIRAFRPDVVHSMEVQIAGYLCMETAKRMGDSFPPWILSSWGSDFALFRKLGHEPWLRAICRRIDGYMADCVRDQATARSFGYTGPDLPVVPASGGMDIDAVAKLAAVPPSARRLIMVKGYHNWAGRGLLALSALKLVKDRLAGYRIGILAAGVATTRWARQFEAAGLRIEVYPYVNDHRLALARLAEARLIIGLSISDGLPMTVLEAMALGVLPVQTTTSCIGEWVVDGKTALMVSPHDTRAIADAVIRGISDDALVERAAEENLRTVRARWSISTNRARVWQIYQDAIG
jgi:hypothetical protein